MPRGRTYELKAVFSAENKAGRTIAALERKLAKLQERVDSLSKEDAQIGVGITGAVETEKRLSAVERKVKDVDGETAKVDVEINERKRRKTIEGIDEVERRLATMKKRPTVVDIDANAAQAERKMREIAAEARELSRRAYRIEMRAEASGFTEASARAQKLKEQADELNRQRINIAADIRGTSKILRDAGLIKVAMNEVEGTYHVRVDTSSLASARGAVLATQAAFKGYFRALNQAGPISATFAKRIYVLQQAMSVFRTAVLAVAIAAAGPLVAGLTIAGASLLTMAGGFGLVIAAAAPIISFFANAQQRAQELKTAQSELATAQDQVATTANAVADAERGVGDAYRTGQESIRQAILAHDSAVRGVESANRSYTDAQEAAAQATQDVAMATREYNTALATEQFRLRSMQLDVKGMQLSQKQLALDMAQARKDIAKAESPQERKEAQLRLQQMQLQQKQGTLDIAMAQRELNEAQKNGTSELQSAKQAREQAMDSQKDAIQGVRDALIGVKEAQLQENEAARAVGQARADAARQMADANRQLAEAQKAHAEAQKDAASKQQALNALMSKAPKHLQQMQAAVNRFKAAYNESFAAAQRSTARLGVRLIDLGTRTMPMLGHTANRTAQGLNKAFSNIARNFRELGVIENFHRILGNMPNITKNWTQAIGNFGGAFINIMGQAMPFARDLAQNVRRTSRAFLEWTDSEKGRQQIHRFFKSAGPVAHALWTQIKRIGGALLRWSTQSKKGPQQIARAIKILGDIVMGTAHFIGFMIKMWRAVPGPIQKVIVAAFLLHTAFRFLLGGAMARAITVAGARMIWWAGKTAVTRLAATRLGLAFVGASRVAAAAFGRAMLTIVMKARVGAMMAGRAFAAAGGPFTLGIAAAAWYMVNVFNRAYKSITQTAPMVGKGIAKMMEQGSINGGQAMIATFRIAVAETYRIVVGAFQDIKFKIADLLGNIPGLGRLTEQWKKDTQEDMNATYRSIAGKTALAAKEMGQNMNTGRKNATKNIDATRAATVKDMDSIRKNTADDMTAMKLAMINNTKEAKNKGSDNINALKGNSNDYTANMKDMGIKNFTDFQRSGTKQSDLLKSNATEKFGLMQAGVNKSSDTTKVKTIDDLVQMQRDGTSTMRVAQEEWVKYAWDTSIYTQQAFNAILEGLGRFIDKANIDMKKPEQFSIIGNKNAGKLAGNSNSPGLTPNQRRLARGGVHEPVGGVAQGTTRVYGEVPGTTEFYITDNKKYLSRNMEILSAANEHMAKQAAGSVPKTRRPPGMTSGQARERLETADRKASMVKEARGGTYGGPGSRVRGGEIRNLGGTTHNWGPLAQKIQAATTKAISGITTNTYIGHPGGEGNSVDHWGPGGRGANIGTSKGNEVENYLLNTWKKDMEYYIWRGVIHGWGGSKPYSDKSDQHFDHLHATYQAGANLAGAAGGSGPSPEQVNKWFEDAVPTMPNNLGYGKLGEAASMLGSKARKIAKELYTSKVSTSSGGLSSGNSPKGLTIGEALSQGGWPDSQLVKASSTVWHESRGNAHAQNPSGARGLMQIMPQTAKGVGADYGKLYDPVYNTSAGKKVFDQAGGWGPWVGAGMGGDYRNKKVTGYSNGGVVTRPHLGLIGDKGPEVNLPLHDPRALNMMRKAFDMSERVSGVAARVNRVTARGVERHRDVDISTGRGRDDRLDNVIKRHRQERNLDDRIERAIDKMRRELIQEFRDGFDLKDDASRKLMRAGAEMVLDMMRSPQIGGKLANQHFEDDSNFWRELTKR